MRFQAERDLQFSNNDHGRVVLAIKVEGPGSHCLTDDSKNLIGRSPTTVR